MKKMSGVVLGSMCVAALGFAAVPETADAAPLNLSCELITPGPNLAPATCPVAPIYSVPGQYNYTQAFTAPQGSGTIAGSDIYGGPSNGFLGAAGFVDDYLFQITSAQADVISATINLGGQYSIDNLFAKVYSLDSNPGGLLASGVPNGPVFYGTINTNGPVTFIQIDPVALTAGSYVLEVSGISDGSLGGSYTGTLNLGTAAVPLPAGLPLLISGMGTLAAFVRRRRLSLGAKA